MKKPKSNINRPKNELVSFQGKRPDQIDFSIKVATACAILFAVALTITVILNTLQ